MLVCNIEESQVRTQSAIGDVRAYVEFEEDPATALAVTLADLGVSSGRVGIESHRLPASALRTLTERLPGIEWIGVDGALEKLQVVKTDDEVDTLATLARSLLGALDGTVATLGSSAGEIDYAGELVARIARSGALPLFLVFSSGERTVLGHPEAERKPLEPGVVWRTDFGARLPGGLAGDVARTGTVGAPSAEQQEVFAVLRAAQDAAVALAEPGRPAHELFRATKRTFEKNRLAFVMPHVGHGIGVGLHEAPILEPRNDSPLAIGTVLNIEPFAVLSDRREGYHTEDLVLVTASGPRRLTDPQSDLLVIG